MNKPTKKQKNPLYDYHEVIDYIENKYNIDTRDYAKSHGWFQHWLEVVGQEAPNYPSSNGDKSFVKINGKFTQITQEEYDERFKVIHAQYKEYQLWCVSNPSPPYLDFWHWLTDNDFIEVSNGCEQLLQVSENLLCDDTPSWCKEILQLIYNEYQEDEMEVWIEW